MTHMLIRKDEWFPTTRAREEEMTDALIDKISRWNEYMTPDEVRTALLAGKVVCTNFHSYKLKADAEGLIQHNPQAAAEEDQL